MTWSNMRESNQVFFVPEALSARCAAPVRSGRRAEHLSHRAQRHEGPLQQLRTALRGGARAACAEVCMSRGGCNPNAAPEYSVPSFLRGLAASVSALILL